LIRVAGGKARQGKDEHWHVSMEEGRAGSREGKSRKGVGKSGWWREGKSGCRDGKSRKNVRQVKMEEGKTRQ